MPWAVNREGLGGGENQAFELSFLSLVTYAAWMTVLRGLKGAS